jgi:hypothetical protein
MRWEVNATQRDGKATWNKTTLFSEHTAGTLSNQHSFNKSFAILL